MREMKSAVTTMALLALLFCGLSGSGCSWTGITGNGYRSYDQVKPCLPSAEQQQLENWQDRAQTNEIEGQPARHRLAGAFFMGLPLEGPFRGYDFHLSHKTSKLPLVWGGSTRWWDFWEPVEGNKGRPVVHRGMTRGFLYPLLLARQWYEAYDPDTGEPIALKSSGASLLGLLSYSHFIMPQEPRRPREGFPPRRGRRHLLHGNKSVSEVTFLHHRGFSLVYGLLGAADRNGRAYLELLFVKIPLWSTGSSSPQDDG